MGRRESQTDATFLDVQATLVHVGQCAERILRELQSTRDSDAIALEALEIRQWSDATKRQLAEFRREWVAAGKPELRRILEQKELWE